MVEFTEKVLKQETWINGGFFVFEPEVLDYLSGDDEPLEQAPLAALRAMASCSHTSIPASGTRWILSGTGTTSTNFVYPATSRG